MNIDLNGKRALVCGASQGIGAAIARELAQLGAHVIGLARSQDKLETLIADLPGEGHKALIHNLADRPGLEERITRELVDGPIHILINNTGGPAPGPIAVANEDAFRDGFAKHVLVSSLLVRLLSPGMTEAGYGRVINIISTSVKIPIPNLGVSNTIRGAMASWAKTLASEVAPKGITVNNILPGFTETPRLAALIQTRAQAAGTSEEEMAATWRRGVPAGRFGAPEEVAAAAAFLASPAAAYINGINLPVDGGRTGCL